MLNKLLIKNYAIIDEAEISFSPRFSIITGETGAGKSIILGALSLILGQRADSKTLFRQKDKCIIEGHFNIAEYKLQSFFNENDLDYDEHTTLRREITADGKSRAFINDTPVNLSALKALGELLVDIHSQHETLALNSGRFQLQVVDSLCKHSDVLQNYRIDYKNHKAKIQSLNDLKEQSNQAKVESDFLQFQFDELNEAKLKPEEQELLEQELNTLSHAEEIKSGLNACLYLLDEQESSVESQLKQCIQQIQPIEKVNPEILTLSERIKSCLIELKDIDSEIERIANNTLLDTDRMQLVQERLDLIYHLQQKHRVKSMTELIQIQTGIEEKLNNFSSLDSQIETLEKQITKEHLALLTLAKKISKKRSEVIPFIENNIKKMLLDLAMPDARLHIEQSVLADEGYTLQGIDEIRFLFSANKGQALSELEKVASGGELSRLMLCIKSLVANHTQLPTIIFDEIDTGVSGEVAHKVGTILESLSEVLQVISITHLPQIASKGNTHLFVYKETKEEQTYTRIKILNPDERIVEIAKMLSGESPSTSAIANAQELLNKN